MNREIDFNNFTYYFKNLNLAPINFIGFRGPLHIFEEIKNDNISIKKLEEDQEKNKKKKNKKKNFESKLNETTTGNPKHKEKYQLDTIKNMIQCKKLAIYLMFMQKLDLKLCMKHSREQDLKN